VEYNTLRLFHFTDEMHKECFVFLWCSEEASESIRRNARLKRNTDFGKYGTIIVHGIGTPSPELIEEMANEYGYEEIP